MDVPEHVKFMVRRCGGRNRGQTGEASHPDPRLPLAHTFSFRRGPPAQPGIPDIPRLSAGIHDDVAHDARGIEDKGAAFGHAASGVKDPVRAGDGTVRPEIGQKIEAVVFLLRVGPLRELTVDRDGQHRGVGILEEGEVVPDLA